MYHKWASKLSWVTSESCRFVILMVSSAPKCSNKHHMPSELMAICGSYRSHVPTTIILGYQISTYRMMGNSIKSLTNDHIKRNKTAACVWSNTCSATVIIIALSTSKNKYHGEKLQSHHHWPSLLFPLISKSSYNYYFCRQLLLIDMYMKYFLENMNPVVTELCMVQRSTFPQIINTSYPELSEMEKWQEDV